MLEFIGMALWDVFSQNHKVIDAAGTAYDLGSFRASAGFIAESINRRYSVSAYRDVFGRLPQGWPHASK